MRQFTLVLFVCASIVLGAPVHGQDKKEDKSSTPPPPVVKVQLEAPKPPPAPPVTKPISAIVRLKTPLTVAGDSVIAQGSVIGITPEGWLVSGLVLLEDGIELVVPPKRFLSSERLTKTFKLPTGSTLPKGTDLAPGSVLVIPADYEFPAPLILFGSGALEPGAAADKEDLTVEALLQRNRVKVVQTQIPALQAAAAQVHADAKAASDARVAAQLAQVSAEKILTDVEAKAAGIKKEAMDGAKAEAQNLLKNATTKMESMKQEAVAAAKATAKAEAAKVAKEAIAPLVTDLGKLGKKLEKVTDDLRELKKTPEPAPAPAAPKTPAVPPDRIQEPCYRGLWIERHGLRYVHVGNYVYERR